MPARSFPWRTQVAAGQDLATRRHSPRKFSGLTNCLGLVGFGVEIGGCAFVGTDWRVSQPGFTIIKRIASKQSWALLCSGYPDVISLAVVDLACFVGLTTDLVPQCTGQYQSNPNKAPFFSKLAITQVRKLSQHAACQS